MIHLAITALVLAALAYAYYELRGAYGSRMLLKLFILTTAFFFVKEYLQANNWLLHHYYHPNKTVWVSVFGVPPFIVFGHLFVVVMTWQLAVMYMHRMGLTGHPAVMVTLVFYFTGTISMTMESTGVVGGWWQWAMPSWWFYPNLLGAPLVDLPWERPITTAWGYFISVFWFVAVVADLPSRWTPRRLVVLLGGLAVLLELSRSTPFMSFWGVFVSTLLPAASVAVAGTRAGPAWNKVFAAGSPLQAERRPRWNGAVFAGLAAMILVSVIQVGARSKWLALVSLFPVATVAVGCWRLWPVWVDCLISIAVMGIGAALNNGNVILAGWLVFRFTFVLCLLAAAIRWKEGRLDGTRPERPPAASQAVA